MGALKLLPVRRTVGRYSGMAVEAPILVWRGQAVLLRKGEMWDRNNKGGQEGERSGELEESR